MQHIKTRRFLENRYSVAVGDAAYLAILWEEFEKRHLERRRYSLRSFSREIGLDLGHISRIFSRKRIFRPSTALRLCKRLELSEGDRILFLESIKEMRRRKPETKPLH